MEGSLYLQYMQDLPNLDILPLLAIESTIEKGKHKNVYVRTYMIEVNSNTYTHITSIIMIIHKSIQYR